jgi:multicomponent Na+:H+ antiporter subunit B
VTRGGRPRELRADEPRHRHVFGAVICLGQLAALVIAMVDLPDGSQPLSAIARRAMEESIPAFHLTEPVNAVVYGIRAMDTFGETFLLLAAVVSVVVVTRSPEVRKGFFGEARVGEEESTSAGDDTGGGEDDAEGRARQAEEQEEGEEDEAPRTPDSEPVGGYGPERAHAMTVVARSAIRVVLPFLMTAGIYLVVQGYSPGGGFPAGVVLLGAVLLVYTAFGHPAVRLVVNDALMESVEMIAAVVIILDLVLALPFAGSFGAQWLPLLPLETVRSGGSAQVFSTAECVEVASGLVIAVFALLGMRHEWGRDPEQTADSGDDAEGDEAELSHGGAP